MLDLSLSRFLLCFLFPSLPKLFNNVNPVTFAYRFQHNNHLQGFPLQFIRAHQQAFDVEPIFPLQLFEDFVASVKGDLAIEASCKIEFDKLIASRFLLFFKDLNQLPASTIKQTLSFFHQVEKRVGVQINYDLLLQFMSRDPDFYKSQVISSGIDLRGHLSEDSLKMHIRFDKAQNTVETNLELIETALKLGNLDDHSLELLDACSQFIPKNKLIPQVGFDFYLDGHSVIELYLQIEEEYFRNPEVQELLQQRFSESALQPLEGTNCFGIGLSNVNVNPVFYYRLKKKQDLPIYFRTNSTAERVSSFYQHQVTEPFMNIGVAEQELQNSQIENIRLYYYKRFSKQWAKEVEP